MMFLAICGSRRRASTNAALLAAIKRHAPDGIAIEIEAELGNLLPGPMWLGPEPARQAQDRSRQDLVDHVRKMAWQSRELSDRVADDHKAGQGISIAMPASASQMAMKGSLCLPALDHRFMFHNLSYAIRM